MLNFYLLMRLLSSLDVPDVLGREEYLLVLEFSTPDVFGREEYLLVLGFSTLIFYDLMLESGCYQRSYIYILTAFLPFERTSPYGMLSFIAIIGNYTSLFYFIFYLIGEGTKVP